MISNISTQLPPLQAPKAGIRPVADGALSAPAPNKNDVTGEINDEQKTQVQKLKKIDQEVRNHERAHKTVGGQYAGSASFTYTKGPDGQRYAVGGEVPIDTSPVEGNPEATLAKLDVVIAAALAPAKPSAQDLKVAASAVTARNQARIEFLDKKENENSDDNSNENPFDVNDFGSAPSPLVSKAYANGNGLGIDIEPTGSNFSITS